MVRLFNRLNRKTVVQILHLLQTVFRLDGFPVLVQIR